LVESVWENFNKGFVQRNKTKENEKIKKKCIDQKTFKAEKIKD
jgi:hypothetical protein